MQSRERRTPPESHALLLPPHLSSLPSTLLSQGTHEWVADTLPRLAPGDECLALAGGVLTPVRVAPVPVDPAAVAQAAAHPG